MFENTMAGEFEQYVPKEMEGRFSLCFEGTGMYVYDEWTGDSMTLDMIDDAESFIEEQIALYPAREVSE